MANTAGIVQVTVKIVPEETVVSTTVSSIWQNLSIKTNTLCPEMNALTDTVSLSFNDSGKSSHGYRDGFAYYRQVSTTSTAVLGADITNVEFAFFKHSGYRFSSETDSTCDYDNDPTITCDANDFIEVGMRVTGSGIPANSHVASVNVAGAVTSFELEDIDGDAVSTTGGAVTDGTCKFFNHATTSATVSTDSLEIRGGADDGFVIAVLAPGEAIVLPVKSSAGWGTADDRVSSDDYFFQSVDSDDIDTAGGNDIAMEFFCATAS